MDCCSIDNRCRGVSGSVRCGEIRVPNSDHCSYHQRICVPLYLEYKYKQETAEQAYESVIAMINIDEITEVGLIDKLFNKLLVIYYKLHEAYNGRVKHRRVAYWPAFYDAGHDYQFVHLKNLMVNTEKIITMAYEKHVLLTKNVSGIVGDNLVEKKTRIINTQKDKITKIQKKIIVDEYDLQNECDNVKKEYELKREILHAIAHQLIEDLDGILDQETTVAYIIILLFVINTRKNVGSSTVDLSRFAQCKTYCDMFISCGEDLVEVFNYHKKFNSECKKLCGWLSKQEIHGHDDAVDVNATIIFGIKSTLWINHYIPTNEKCGCGDCGGMVVRRCKIELKIPKEYIPPRLSCYKKKTSFEFDNNATKDAKVLRYLYENH